MTSPRTRAILETLGSGIEPEMTRGVLRLFGASSIDECLSIYDSVGAAERSGLDEAVERLAANVTTKFPDRATSPERARPTSDLPPVESGWLPADSPVVPRAGSGMQTYQIRRQLAIARSYRVDDGEGARHFTIAGKLRFPRAFSVRDANGNVLYDASEKVLSIDRRFLIRRDGAEAAVLTRKTTSGAIRDQFEIVLQSGQTLHASGKLWDDDGVQIVRDSTRIAFIRRQPRAFREIFSATLLRSADQGLLLAIAMSIVEIDPLRGRDE